MTYKLDDICQQGGFLNAFVFHISGYNWAATNSAELKTLFDAGDATASSLRSSVFSNAPGEVQMLQILDNDLGPQTVSYNEDKGLNVGGWGVNLFSNPSGYQFGNGVTVDSVGVMGLNWQPNLTTSGFAYSVLGADLNCDTTTGYGYVEFPKDKGGTLYDWFDDNYVDSAFTTTLVLWVGSACLLVTEFPVSSGDNWKVEVQAQCWNSPNEFIPQRIQSQNIYVTNFPQSIQGQTASLWGYHTDKDGALSTGTDGYLLRHGKCKPNSQIDTSGTWKITCSGATDTLKFKLNRNSFRGHLNGYLFHADDYDGEGFGETGVVAYHRPHVSLCRITVNSGSITADDYYTGDLNSGTEFFTLDLNEVKIKLVATLNSIAPVSAKFWETNGDIIYADSDDTATLKHYYLISGPAQYCTGVGYVSRGNLDAYLNECTARVPKILEPLIADSNLSDERWFLSGAPPVSLRSSDENNEEDMNDRTFYYVTSYSVNTQRNENHNFTRSKGFSSYFYPFNLERPLPVYVKSPEKSLFDQEEKAPPYTDGNTGFKYTSSNESTLVADDIVQFGESGEDLQIWCEVDSTNLSVSNFEADTYVTGLGWGFCWNRGIQEALVNDQNYISKVNNALSTKVITIGFNNDFVGKTAADYYNGAIKDPFELIGKSSISDAGPVEVIKALVGDPSSTLQIPVSIKQTSIGYIFDRGTASDGINRELIDFDSLQDVIDNCQYTGVTYTFPFFDSSTDSVDLIAIIQGLLNTHGGRMVYSWDEAKRAFVISFTTGLNTSIAEAVNAGRDFTNSDIAENKTNAIYGGDWHYNKISSEYKNRDGEKTKLNVSLKDSRIQHTLEDKVFTIKDFFTVLNSSIDDFDSQVLERLSSLLQTLSTVQYQQQVPMKIKNFARLATGVGHLFNWEGLVNRETGKVSEDVFGDVKKVIYDLTSFTCQAFVSTRTVSALGYAPSMAATISGTPGAGSVNISFNTASNQQEFQDPDKGMTDAGYFDCYRYLNATQSVQSRSCGCSDYGVVFFLRNESDCFYDATYATSIQNVYKGTISIPIAAAQLDNGSQTITITYDTAMTTASGHNIATKMPDTTEIIVLFDARDGDDIQDCQTRLYGYLGDSKGQVSDGSASHGAILVGN